MAEPQAARPGPAPQASASQTPSATAKSTGATAKSTGATAESATSILFIGDVVGGIGRHTLVDCLRALRESQQFSFVVVNAENAAGGLGITPRIARSIFEAGVDAITLGNHAYHRREVYPYLDEEPRIVRPANYLRCQPGHGTCVVESKQGIRLGVINLSGNLYVQAGRPAFTEIETAIGELGEVDHILVDMHAEASSEKVGLGWHLDGRVTAVLGTHTHVPTADARVLPQGTAYITDVGMTGPRGGVIGVKKEQAIESMLTQMPTRFETSDVDPWMNAVLIRCSRRLKADSIEQILMPRP